MSSLIRATVFVALFGVAWTSSHAADAKIEWIRNVYGGVEKSMKEEKPLVVLFMAAGTEFCRKLDRDVLDQPEMHALAGRAIFVWAENTDEDQHGNYAQLKKDLKIERFPVLVVLKTAPDEMEEIGRVVGYFPAEQYVAHVKTMLGLWEQKHPGLLVAVPAQEAALPEGWMTYLSRAADFQVAMPQKPKTLEADDHVKQFAFASQTSDGAVHASVHAGDFLKSLLEQHSADQLLRMQAQWFATARDGVVQGAEAAPWGGYPGLRFRIQPNGKDDPHVVQCVLVGRRMYTLAVRGPKVSFTQDEVTLFLKSFEVPSLTKATQPVASKK